MRGEETVTLALDKSREKQETKNKKTTKDDESLSKKEIMRGGGRQEKRDMVFTAPI